MLKKIIKVSMLFVLLLLPSLVRAQIVNFESNAISVEAGETINIQVNASDMGGLVSADFGLEYDSNFLEYKDVQMGVFTDLDSIWIEDPSFTDLGGGKKEFELMVPIDSWDFTGTEGVLATISFLVLEGSGETELKFTYLNVFTEDDYYTAVPADTGSPMTIGYTVAPEEELGIMISDPSSDGVYIYENESNILNVSGISTGEVSEVSYELDTGDSGTAIGTSTWSVDIELIEGLNTAVFTATDIADNTASTTLIVDYSTPSLPQISFRENLYEVGASSSFDVIIDIADLEEVEAVEFIVRYDPRYLSYEDMTILSLMDPIDPFETVEDTEDLSEESKELTVKIYTEIFNSISGSGEIVSLSFLASTTENTSDLAFSDFTVFPYDIFLDPIEGLLGSSTVINISIPDTEAPVMYDFYPQSSLDHDVNDLWLGFSSDEIADCYYSTLKDAEFSSFHLMDKTQDTKHSLFVEDLQEGNEYDFYFVCEDQKGNKNDEAIKYSIKVDEKPVSSGSGSSFFIYLNNQSQSNVEDEEGSEKQEEEEEGQGEEDVLVLGVEYEYSGEGTSTDETEGDKTYSKYTQTLLKSDQDQSVLEKCKAYIVEGTKTSLRLGMGERAGVLESYYLVYGRYPESSSDWEDLDSIANGKWPKQVVDFSEMSEALLRFERIYQRDFDIDNINDRSALILMHYGVRPEERNMDKERKAIEYFRKVFGRDPVDTMDWNTVRAIAYSGAKR